jgi:carbonic anhydrase/acetyltransferase-like protein (isoleucine patch superfamily)
MIIEFEKRVPFLGDEIFVAPNATVIGDVSLRAHSSVWFNALLRGDQNSIDVGEESNIQDGAILHCDPSEFPGYPIAIGRRTTIGHGAILHGCTVSDYCLIGSGSIVLDAVKIGHHSLVAAGAVLVPGLEVPPYSLVAGVPGKIARPVRDAELRLIEQAALIYLNLALRYQKSSREIG